MKRRSTAARLVPAIMVAAATAIPAATAADLLTHSTTPTSRVAIGSSTSGTMLPSASSGSGRSTRSAAAKATSSPTPGGASGSGGKATAAATASPTPGGASGSGGKATAAATASPTPGGASGSGGTATPVATASPTPATASAPSATVVPSATATASTVSKTVVGTAEQNQYGTVQVTLVVTGNKVTGAIVTAPQDNPRSASINAYAVPILRSETLQAQSANIDAVSGATYTSESYIGSLQAALTAAHL